MRIIFTKATCVQVIDIYGDTFYKNYKSNDVVQIYKIEKVSDNYSTIFLCNGEIFVDVTNSSFKV